MACILYTLFVNVLSIYVMFRISKENAITLPEMLQIPSSKMQKKAKFMDILAVQIALNI